MTNSGRNRGIFGPGHDIAQYAIIVARGSRQPGRRSLLSAGAKGLL
jgi:hypothetical protein